MKNKTIPVYNVILWNVNHDQIEYYDIMPYLICCWKDEKKRRHKIWDYEHKFSKDATRMPATFDEFKDFVEKNCLYRFWSKSEYELIVCGWPKGKNETKIDAYDQIMQNIDIVTGLFMSRAWRGSAWSSHPEPFGCVRNVVNVSLKDENYKVAFKPFNFEL